MDYKKKYFKYKTKYLELKKQIGGETPIEINDEIKKYIKKWVSIENIVCRHGDNPPLDIGNKVGFRSFIDDSNWKGKRDEENNVIDSCEKIDLDNCEKNDRCKIYKSSKGEKCINASRIKFFEGNELAQKITGKFGDKFKLYYTIPFNLDDIKISLYCHILVNNNDIYVLFNCGKIFDSNALYKQEFIEYLNKLFSKIMKYKFNKLILCGYSMGCVLALRFGYFIFKNFKNTFFNKCLIIGAAPFKWMPKDEKEFNNLPNVFIFINKLFGYDRILIENENNEKNFNLNLPLYVLQYEFNEDAETKAKKKKVVFSIKKIIELPEDHCSKRNFDICHNWTSYFDGFVKALKFT